MNDMTTPAGLVERARALQPQLKERAAAVEQARVVGQETISEFRKAGFFRILQPKAYGGYELSPEVLSNVIFEVASACGSSGWTLAVLGLHQWEVQLLPEEGIKEIWGNDSELLLSSAYAPTGQVEPAEGGYLLTGEWPFSSGCDHAEWAIVGGIRPPGSASDQPTHCGFFVPRSDYEIIDDWRTMGLAGTGSKRLKMERVFVPQHRHHPIFGATPPLPAGAGAIYRLSFGPVFGEMLAAAAHGMAQGVLDRFVERNKARVATLDRSKSSENPDIHRYIAETDYAIRAARALSRSNQQTALNVASEGRDQETIDKARHLWEMARSVHSCSEAIQRLFSISGAHTIFEGDSMQRAFRDLQSATTHMGFSFNLFARNYGAMQMGHPNTLNLI